MPFIKGGQIEINSEFTELRYLALAESPAPHGETHQAIGTQDRVQIITAVDITQDVCCVVEAKKERSRPVQTVVYMEAKLVERIQPHITTATIRTIADRSNKRTVDPPVALGQELEVVYDYTGSPLIGVSVVGQRESNKTGQTVFEGDRYIPSGSDAHQSLSVVLVASARIEAVKKDLKSTPFESKAIVIQPNPGFERLASTRKRSSKAQSAITLVTSESAVVCLEGQDAKAPFLLHLGDSPPQDGTVAYDNRNLFRSVSPTRAWSGLTSNSK